MDARTSKKMAITRKEIAELEVRLTELCNLVNNTLDFKPITGDGKDAQTQHVEDLRSKQDNVNAEIKKLRIRLEIETVAMLAGVDTDIAEPTAAETLRQAS